MFLKNTLYKRVEKEIISLMETVNDDEFDKTYLIHNYEKLAKREIEVIYF